MERGGEKLVDEAILDKNGSNDDDDKIVARLTPRVPSLVARGGKHSRHSRHPLSGTATDDDDDDDDVRRCALDDAPHVPDRRSSRTTAQP